jgi:hypothetical protein
MIMKKLLFLLVLIFGIGISSQAQSILDQEERVDFCYALGDTVSIIKEHVARPRTARGMVQLLPTGFFDFTGRPPTIIWEVSPDTFGYADVHALRRDLESMFSQVYDMSYAYDESNNMDTMWCILPSADTAYFKVYTYDESDNLLTVSKPQH